MFWEIFNSLCNEHNIKPNTVAKEIGIPSGSVTDWKKGRIPRDGTLIKIADYFNVSIDYLLGRDQKEKSATEEKPLPDILYRYNELSEEKQREVISFIEFKLAQQKEKPDDYIGQIAAFGSGPSDVPYNEKAARDLARYAKKLREKEQGKEKER